MNSKKQIDISDTVTDNKNLVTVPAHVLLHGFKSKNIFGEYAEQERSYQQFASSDLAQVKRSFQYRRDTLSIYNFTN